MQTYVKALQIASQAVSNLNDADPFNLLPNSNHSKIQQRTVYQRSVNGVQSHGSDPVAVTATYMVVPDSFIVVRSLFTVLTTYSIYMLKCITLLKSTCIK